MACDTRLVKVFVGDLVRVVSELHTSPYEWTVVEISREKGIGLDKGGEVEWYRWCDIEKKIEHPFDRSIRLGKRAVA